MAEQGVSPIDRAVAVSYTTELPAPVVMYKGQRHQAGRVVDLARAHGIRIMHDPDLAEDLYNLDIAELIPEKLYEPVARLLQFVYTMQEDE